MELKVIRYHGKVIRRPIMPPGVRREDHLSVNSSFRFIRIHFNRFSILASKHIGAVKIHVSLENSKI